MTYNKPEVAKLDSALNLIQGSSSGKPSTVQPDSSQTDHRVTTIGAYEADE